MRRYRVRWPSFPRSRNLASPARADDRKSNEMQPIATEIKGSPLLATRNEANQGHSEVMLPHRVRVSGGPNEATVVSFPASPLGGKRGQTRPNGSRNQPTPYFSAHLPGAGMRGSRLHGNDGGLAGTLRRGVLMAQLVLLRTAHLLAVMPVRCCCFSSRRHSRLSRSAHVCTLGAGRAEHDGAEAVPYGCRTPAEWPASISSVVGAS